MSFRLNEVDLLREQLLGAEARAARSDRIAANNRRIGEIDEELAFIACRQVLNRYASELATQRHERALAIRDGLPHADGDILEAQYQIVLRIRADLKHLAETGKIYEGAI